MSVIKKINKLLQSDKPDTKTIKKIQKLAKSAKSFEDLKKPYKIDSNNYNDISADIMIKARDLLKSGVKTPNVLDKNGDIDMFKFKKWLEK